MDGVLGLVLPQMTLASSFLQCRQMLVVAVVAPETTFSLAARASERDRVLERLSLEAASTLPGLAIRDILLTFPAEKIFLVNEELNQSKENKECCNNQFFSSFWHDKEHFFVKTIFPLEKKNAWKNFNNYFLSEDLAMIVKLINQMSYRPVRQKGLSPRDTGVSTSAMPS